MQREQHVQMFCGGGNLSVYDGFKEVPPCQSRKSQGEEAESKMRKGRMEHGRIATEGVLLLLLLL